MARWRLTEPHYLNVDGTKWEYSEVDRITGRPKRVQFPVPQYLNPNYEDDLKSFGQGQGDVSTWDIIVSDGNNPGPKDVIFKEKDGSPGQPTPGMLPLDDDAREITARYSKVWDAPSEGPSFTQRLEESLINQMTELRDSVKQAPQVEGLAELMATMTSMMKQQTEILAKLAERHEPTATGAVKRRVA